MAESSFVSALRSERATLQAQHDEATRKLPDAERAWDAAKEAYRERLESKGTLSSGPVAGDEELNRACTAAQQVVADLKDVTQRTGARMKEIDRLLGADSNASAVKAQLATVDKKFAECSEKYAQLAVVAATIGTEIAELRTRRAKLRSDAAKSAVAARLSGKAAQPPKALAEIDADLESRTDTVEAAREAMTELEREVAALSEERQAARTRLLAALRGRAELNYYALLPALLPALGALVATQSQLTSGSYREFRINFDDAAVAAAAAAIEAELGPRSIALEKRAEPAAPAEGDEAESINETDEETT